MKYRILILFFAITAVNAEIFVGQWKPVFKGIRHAVGYADSEEPRIQKVSALKIDLHEPSIKFYTTPSNGSTPGDTMRQTGSQFIASSGVQAAVNGQFYGTSAEIDWNANLIGLSISEANIVSQPENLSYQGCSLLIDKDNKVRFEVTSTSSNLSGVWTAIESWPWFLRDGVNISDPTTSSVAPRTAVGLTEDDRHLIIITIDGRQPLWSHGATYQETAEWLKRFGAYNGLSFDGGGSTHMLISDSKGGTVTLNRPSEDRAVGNHLGIFAESLPDGPYMGSESVDESAVEGVRCNGHLGSSQSIIMKRFISTSAIVFLINRGCLFPLIVP